MVVPAISRLGVGRRAGFQVLRHCGVSGRQASGQCPCLCLSDDVATGINGRVFKKRGLHMASASLRLSNEAHEPRTLYQNFQLNRSAPFSSSASEASAPLESTPSPSHTNTTTCSYIPIHEDILNTIQQLPEVHLTTMTNSSLFPHRIDHAIDLLERAAQVFDSAGLPTGKERRAVRTLLAYWQGTAGRHEDAAKTYKRLRTELTKQPQSLMIPLPLGAFETILLKLAEAKAYFHAGKFDRAFDMAHEVLLDTRDKRHKGEAVPTKESGTEEGHATKKSEVAAPLMRRAYCFLRGCALNGAGLSLLVQSLSQPSEDASAKQQQDALQKLRDAVKELSEGYEAAKQDCAAKKGTEHDGFTPDTGRVIRIGPTALGLAAAAAMGNLGVAEALLLDDKNQALETWRNGGAFLASMDPERTPTPHLETLSRRIRARLLCNEAAFLLQSIPSVVSKVDEPDKEDNAELKQASKAAKEALQLYQDILQTQPSTDDDESNEETNATTSTPLSDHRLGPAMGRPLSLVASCYHRAGAAVTAEGLYQSALELLTGPASVASAPLSTLDARRAMEEYAGLCENGWDGKRGGDAARLRKRAGDLWAEKGEKDNEEVGWSMVEDGLCGGVRFTHPGDFI